MSQGHLGSSGQRDQGRLVKEGFLSWALETMDNNSSYLTERPPCAAGFNPHAHLCSERQKSSVFNCPEAQGSNPDQPTL